MSEWQPIETAPKDGTEILAWRADCGVLLVRYMCMEDFLTERELEGHDEETTFQDDWWCADFVTGCRLEGSVVPTHWMPLPTPPAPGGAG